MQSALLAVPGVRNVDVEFFAKEAYVTYDPSVATLADLTEALKRSGKYGGSFKKWGIPTRKQHFRAPPIEATGKPLQVYDPAFTQQDAGPTPSFP